MKNDLKAYDFILEMEVRDYELDCEQIVNNAVYLHYFEHTRHKFCIKAGIPFIKMHEQGMDAVVRKIELEYFNPLRSGDSFKSCLRVEREGARFIFYQDLYKADGSPSAKAKITIVALKDGKLSRGDEWAKIFSSYLA